MPQYFATKYEVLTWLMEHQNQMGKDVSVSTLKTYAGEIYYYLIWKNDSSTNTPNEFLKGLANTCAYATISKKLFAIKFYYFLSKEEEPFSSKGAKALLSSIKRRKGVKQRQAKVYPITHLKSLLNDMQEDTASNLRNRAIILVSYIGAFRRSELLGLRKQDVIDHEKGLLVSIQSSKSNPYGAAEHKGLFFAKNKRYCPVKALKELIRFLPLEDGDHIFTRIHGNNHFTLKPLTASGMDYLFKKLLGEQYSTHSPRTSFVTHAVQRGLSEYAIALQTNQSFAMIRRYTQIQNKMDEQNAANQMGL